MRKLSEKDRKSLEILKAQYQMKIETREECLLRNKMESVERINIGIQEDLEAIASIDPDTANILILQEKNREKEKSKRQQMMIIEDDDDSVDGDISKLKSTMDEINNLRIEDDDEPTFFAESQPQTPSEPEVQDEEPFEDVSVRMKEVSDNIALNNTDKRAQYDIIPLPSGGQCYKSKVEKLPVGYITARDEDYITSPNLYEAGLVSEVLLKNKVLEKDFDVDELVSGDADAILLFLRATSYGTSLPITVTDQDTGTAYQTTVDLSELKYKEFKLKGDENGHFDFITPITQRHIKFKFLTYKEIKLLQKLNKKESNGMVSLDINTAIDSIKRAINADGKLSVKERVEFDDITKRLALWDSKVTEGKKVLPYSKTITNTMELQIVSIDGNADRRYIHKEIMDMPAQESLAFRRYVYDNEPGVDFNVTVEKPQGLGGGSTKCFLEWGDYVFFHIAEL